MKKQTYFPLLISAILFFQGCIRSDDNYKIDTKTLKEIKINPHENSADHSLKLENLEFINLDLPVSDIGDLVFGENCIYVVNNYTFSIFNYRGRLSKIVDIRSLLGPDVKAIVQAKYNIETKGLDLLIDDGQILCSLDNNGRLLRHKDLICPAFTFQPINNFYLFHNGFQICGVEELKNGSSNRLTLTRYNNINDVVARFLRFNFKGLKYPKATIGSENFSNYNGGKDSTLFFESVCDTIYSFHDKELHSKYLINFSNEKGKISEILNDESIVNKSEAINKLRLTTISNVLENKKYLIVNFYFYSNKFNFKLVGYAVYDKERKTCFVQSDGDNPVAHCENVSLKFSSSTFPQFMDRKGNFASFLIPSEIKQELEYEKYNKLLNGPMHQLVTKYHLQESVMKNHAIIALYNFKP